jgi:hypothetical protein
MPVKKKFNLDDLIKKTEPRPKEKEEKLPSTVTPEPITVRPHESEEPRPLAMKDQRLDKVAMIYKDVIIEILKANGMLRKRQQLLDDLRKALE